VAKLLDKGAALLEEHSLSAILPACGLCAASLPPRFLRPGLLAALTAFGLVVMFKGPFVVGARKYRTDVLT
jgi:hypothetical protein